MLKLIYPPRHYFFDTGGKPLIGGYIEYDGLIYQDVFRTVPHQKRILLDEHGSALLYFDDDININIYNRHGDFIETKIIPAQHEWVFFYDKFGKTLKHGKVWVYRFRSTILKDSFAVDDKSFINTNPVLLDNDGKAKIYIDGAYRLKIYNADDVLIADEDVYALPTPIEHQYILTSRKYPQFKFVDLILTSRKYPQLTEQTIVLTSQNYPYIDKDNLLINDCFENGIFLHGLLDSMSIYPEFINGEVRNVLKLHKQINEDVLNIYPEFINGEVRSILISYYAPPEDVLNIYPEFINGEII